ncbi:MAG: protein kinase [Gemmatimonadetes bacterium]|nr:protein kinase [Gemmatimonadota bacterium]
MAELLDQVRAVLADRYAVERELGQGGMATVYLAADRKHHRSVAIKVLNPELGTILGPERFLREIEIAAGLTHPHILPLLDSGESGGLLYYVMPFVEGESLRDRLSREKQLPVAESVRIAREVAAALAYAHSRDVVHRDIKPENVLLSGGEAVVADFGIARAVTAAGGQRLTDTGVVIGTPAYMSPEQATAERQLDGRSDTYSLGCVLYEMLAGQPPFTGPTVESVVHQHLAADAPAVTAIRSTVPAAVAAAIGRALAKAPADRFATAAQFAEALASAAEGTVPPLVVRPRRARWLKLGAGLGLAAAAAVAVLLGRNRSPVIAAASVVAVVPFAPTTPDTGLTRLGRDLVVTLSANLDGVGEIRTVDALTILAHTGDPNQSFTRDDAAALARRLGASSVVQGSLLRAGAAVRLELGLFQTDRDAEVAHASVVASPGDFNALTDSVTWALLRQIWRAREPPTPSLSAVTTRSLTSLRAFLEGERASVDGRWPEAEAAFARAIEADSAFWLAYWRYAYARNWNLLEPDTAIVSAYRRHRDALPERERLLVEAELADSASARLGLLEEVTRRFPDYWPGWMEYADWLVHFAPLLEPVSERARAALERTIALNPRLVPAWTHLAWMAVMEGDSVALSRAVTTLQRLGAPTTGHTLAQYESPRVFRVLDRLLRNGGAADPSLVDSAVAAMTANDALWLWFGFPAAQIKVSRQVQRRGVPAPESAFQLWLIAMSWAARGAWDSAAVALDDYVRADPGGRAALRAYGLAVAGVWLGALNEAAAVHFRSAAVRDTAHESPAAHSERAWLDGFMAATRGDPARVAAARAALRRSTDSAAALLEGSLSTFETTMSGAPAAAGRALAALERERAERTLALTDPDGLGDNHPFVRALDRLAASRWLLAAGDTATALALLAWHDEVRIPMAAFVSKVLSGLVHLELARIEAARGRVAAARVHYEQFLRRYDMPVAAHRHLVTDARRALGEMR